MTTDKKKIPASISDYIIEHYSEDFLFELKDVKKVKGELLYTIEVSKDDYLYTLVFTEKGTLINQEAEQAFPPDTHDEPTA